MLPVYAYPIRDSLYLNVTDRCTLKCQFCPKHKGSNQVDRYDLTLSRPPEHEELIRLIGDPASYDEIVFCGYGEPTLRLKVILKVADHVKSLGGRVRLNTDGLGNLVHKRNVLPEMQGRIDALSVSMNTDTEPLYQLHCQPALKNAYPSMLDFLELAPSYIPDVTATAISGLEGVDIEACRTRAQALGVKFRERQLGIVG